MYVIIGHEVQIAMNKKSQTTLQQVVQRACRHEIIHRQFHFKQGGSGWGFVTKPEHGQDYVRRINHEYIGIYVLRGHGRYVDHQGVEHQVSPGDLMHLPPGREHSVYHAMDGLWAEYYFPMPREMYDTLCALQVVRPEQTLWHVGLHVSMIEQCENQLAMLRLQENEAWLYAQVTLSAANLIMAARQLMLQQASPTQQQVGIMQARQQLEEDWEAQLSLQSLAKNLNMSYERFRKLFKQFVGHSPGEFRILRRIDRAKTLLLKQYTVAETAGQLGYPDAFSFSKQFKRYTGMSPTQFKRTI
jgi:AraC-like DNA-binding protein